METSETLNNKKSFRQTVLLAFDKIPEFLKKFFYTDFYFIILSIFSLAAWITGESVIGFVGIMLLSSLMLIILDDATPGIAMVIFAMMSIPNSYVSGQVAYVPVFVPTVLSLIFHVIIYKPRLKLGKMFVPQIVISIAMLLGGCTCISLDRYLGGLGYTLYLGPAVLAIYALFNQYCKKNPYIKMIDYFAKFLMYVGIVIFIEVVIYYSRLDLTIEQWVNNRVDVGWSISTNLSMMLLLTMPMCFYLASKSKFPFIYLLIACLHYFTSIMTLSRGGILFGAITFFIALVYLTFTYKDKKRLFINYFIVLAVIGIIYACIYEDFNTLIKELLDRGMGTSGRDKLYAEAVRCFKSFPLFGVGLAYEGPNYDIDVVNFYWFHSTFFQILGSLGIVGLIAFAYFYFVRYKQVFSYIKSDKAVWYIFFSMLGFELYSMIDTGTFIPVPFMALMIFINMILETQNEDLKLEYRREYIYGL